MPCSRPNLVYPCEVPFLHHPMRSNMLTGFKTYDTQLPSPRFCPSCTFVESCMTLMQDTNGGLDSIYNLAGSWTQFKPRVLPDIVTEQLHSRVASRVRWLLPCTSPLYPTQRSTTTSFCSTVATHAYSTRLLLHHCWI